jgi:hypothetical protein
LAKSTRFFCVCLGAGVSHALVEIEFPTRLFPAIETSVGDEFDPLSFGHVAELAPHEANLVIGIFPKAMFFSLFITNRHTFLQKSCVKNPLLSLLAVSPLSSKNVRH